MSSVFVIYLSIQKPQNSSEAFTTSRDTSTYINIGELLNDPTTATGTIPFDETTLTILINMINNNTTGGIAGIKSTIEAKTTDVKAITASDLRTNTQGKDSGQSIIVTLGGLNWIVTFVSLDTSGNVIATLWLDSNYQEKWASEADISVGSSSSGQYSITSGKLTSTWSSGWADDTSYAYPYPSNMYGTSYVRVETLNNPNNRTYATNSSTIISGTTQGTTTSEHPFALYTYSGLGLTQYLTTPNQMSWINNLQDPSLRGFETSYNLYNESLSTSGGNYAVMYEREHHSGGSKSKDMTDTTTTTGAVGTFSNTITTDIVNKNGTNIAKTSATTYDTTVDENSYTLKEGYTNWGTDYLWLPSMVETGRNDTYSGLWSTNTAERSASAYSWSRSANADYANSSYILNSSGSVYYYDYVLNSYAVRPALNLNLTAAAADTKIYLDAQGGSGGMVVGLLETDTTLPTITIPTRTGYYFDGYYTGTYGSGTKVYNSDGTPALTVSTSVEDTTLYAHWIVPELLIDPTSATSANPFNETNLTTLINMINNNTTGGIAGIKSTIQAKTPTSGPKAINAADLRANTQGKDSGQSIIVRLGGLNWIVTFVSLDTSGNVIATLWLDNNYQEKWASESDVSVGDSSSGQYSITSGKLTSSWSSGWSTSYSDSAKYPSNMYGTSYIRAVTLNNGGVYATSYTALSSSYEPVSTNKFALYTMPTYGLTDYIATPSQMSWINNLQDTSLIGFNSGYNLYNESLSTSGGNYAVVSASAGGSKSKDMTQTTNKTGEGSTFSNTITTKIVNGNGANIVRTSATTYDTTVDENSYTLKAGYTNWGTDYLWLPSLTETGYSDTYSGLWSTNTAERSSNGASSRLVTYLSWSRSAREGYAYHSYLLKASGSGCDYSDVNFSSAVRPALLLNLTKIMNPGTTITLNDAGGTGGEGSITVNEGDSWPTLSDLPTKTGYTFGGYYTGTSGTGTKIYNADGSPAVSTSTFTENTTLYANWTANTYSVTLKANGGTINSGNITSYTYGTGATLPTNVTRTGYTFAGWYESSTFSGSAVTQITTTDIGAKTYYAKWTATISVAESISGAAIVLTTDKNGTYLEGAQITLTAYAKPDYVFRYWVKNNVKFDNSNTNTVTITVDGNATYTAVFEEAGAKLNCVGVSATKGGMVSMIGDNFAELEDDDLVTFSATITMTGYQFDGWQNSDGEIIGTAQSIRLKKSVVMSSVVIAVFSEIGETGTNGQTGN